MKNFLLKIRSFFYLLPNIMVTLFSKPETIAHPGASPKLSAGFRGSVSINGENCVGCSLCVLDCPAAALALDKKSRNCYRLIHYRDRCSYCGQCELSCKFNAIYMDKIYKEASAERKNFFEVLVDKTTT